MKKFLPLCALAFVLAGCGKNNGPAANNNPSQMPTQGQQAVPGVGVTNAPEMTNHIPGMTGGGTTNSATTTTNMTPPR